MAGRGEAQYETLRMFPVACKDCLVLEPDQGVYKELHSVIVGGSVDTQTGRIRGRVDKDAFVPFSKGAWRCTGCGSFETIGLTIIVALIQRHKMELHPNVAG